VRVCGGLERPAPHPFVRDFWLTDSSIRISEPRDTSPRDAGRAWDQLWLGAVRHDATAFPWPAVSTRPATRPHSGGGQGVFGDRAEPQVRRWHGWSAKLHIQLYTLPGHSASIANTGCL
jgi:hypothetical protein